MDRLLGDCVLAVAVLLSVVTQVRPPRVNFHLSVAIEMINECGGYVRSFHYLSDKHFLRLGLQEMIALVLSLSS